MADNVHAATTLIEPVVKTIEVPCTPEVAFRIFTEDFSRWWPADKHSVSAGKGAAPQSVTLEPRQGGQVLEIDGAGAVHLWGTITRFEPGKALAIGWHIGGGPEEASLVEVNFAAKAAGTMVTLRHSGWEVFGDRARDMREGYNNGWVTVFENAFGDACRG